jgi:hypothetical protein
MFKRAIPGRAAGAEFVDLIPGVYRIDVLWNDHAVWRTFFTIVE